MLHAMLPGRKGRPIAGTSLGQTGQVSRAKSQHWGQRTPGLCTKTQLAVGHPRPPRLSDSPSVPQPGAGGAHSTVLAAGQPSAVSHVTKAEPPVPQVEPALVLAPGAASRTPCARPRWLCVAHRQPTRHLAGRGVTSLLCPTQTNKCPWDPPARGQQPCVHRPAFRAPSPSCGDVPSTPPLPRPRHSACL